jgi:DNA invertase Pin-like site-specific DNA recombinase
LQLRQKIRHDDLVDIVVMADLDRLSRNFSSLLILLKEARQHGGAERNNSRRDGRHGFIPIR